MDKPRKRGRPSRISRESIARAALAMGIDKATIPAIAAHLGVDHSSLYHHVKGRRDIIALAADIAVAELDWRAPEPTNWREELIILTDSLWVLFDRHPGLAEAFHRAEVTPGTGITSFAESVERLQDKGFPLSEAVVAVDMLVDMVQECFVGWWSIDKVETDGRTRRERMIAIWQAEAKRSTKQTAQINAMIDIMNNGRRLWWERKRDIVLDGIALTRERSGTAATKP